MLWIKHSSMSNTTFSLGSALRAGDLGVPTWDRLAAAAAAALLAEVVGVVELVLLDAAFSAAAAPLPPPEEEYAKVAVDVVEAPMAAAAFFLIGVTNVQGAEESPPPPLPPPSSPWWSRWSGSSATESGDNGCMEMPPWVGVGGDAADPDADPDAEEVLAMPRRFGVSVAVRADKVSLAVVEELVLTARGGVGSRPGEPAAPGASRRHRGLWLLVVCTVRFISNGFLARASLSGLGWIFCPPDLKPASRLDMTATADTAGSINFAAIFGWLVLNSRNASRRNYSLVAQGCL
mmetsp:Transcript_88355/g.171095  ORF Transcript_88355/g.171095 Transcript_88355/m.171095 type:complete len:291 (-) Transcript_88355:39-911(-)